MLRVGVTGGIGSGKSLVCEIFRVLGVPVSHADETARYLMEHDAGLIARIKAAFGAAAYENGRLNRAYLSQHVFSQPEKLAQLNALVHPAAIAFGSKWFAAQTTPYAIKEAAIFFESGSHKEVDVMIGVWAPEPLRISRTMKRSNLSEEEVRARMSRQLPEEEKMKRCDFVINNDGTEPLIPQVLALHQQLLEKAAASATHLL